MNIFIYRSFTVLLGLILAFALYAAGHQPNAAASLAYTALVGAGWLYVVFKKPRRWQGLWLFALSWGAFPLLKIIRPYLPWTADPLLSRIDALIWGGQILPAYFQFENHPFSANIIAVCYFLFFFQIPAAVLYYAAKNCSDFFNRLIAGYLMAYIGYFALPAAGPAFTTRPHGDIQGAAAAAVSRIVADGVTGMDVFPSLHTALSVFVTAYFWRHGCRKTALVLMPITAGIVMATIYLRYHYSIDVFAGLILALLLSFDKESVCLSRSPTRTH